jgi:tRNA nucleotidyltransferase (CCA-adding enzyme)
LIDPYGGERDLKARVLRHVSPAFEEDPVRILRLARFAARFTQFTVAPETMTLMRRMVDSGEVDALVPERSWQELSRGLMQAQPSRMFEVLRDCGALARILPELDRLWGVPQPPQHHPEIDTGVHVMMVVDHCARLEHHLSVRFAALTHDLGKGTTPASVLPRHIGHEQRSVQLVREVCARLRIPNDLRDLALLVAAEHGLVHRIEQAHAPAIVRLLERCDAFRRPVRFEELLLACEADARGRAGLQDRDYPQAERLRTALKVALAVDAGAIAAAVQSARNAPVPPQPPELPMEAAQHPPAGRSAPAEAEPGPVQACAPRTADAIRLRIHEARAAAVQAALFAGAATTA